jgi:hypothetical protein
MTVALPDPIRCYFKAESASSDAVAKCFTKDGIVQDEQNFYVGFENIKSWNNEALMRYNFQSRPISVDESEHRTTVISEVSGNFAGSPITRRYIFVLSGNKISSLEITS